MRKLIVMLFALFGAMGVLAQDSPEARQRVAEIRQLYKDAWAAVAYYDTLAMDGLPSSRMVVENDYMASGAGPHHDTVTYFYSVDYDEEKDGDYAEIYLITRKYNIGGFQYYEEYLYDSKGKPCFLYWRCSEGVEARYYWDEKGRLVHSVTKGGELPPVAFYLKYAGDLKTAFNTLMNLNSEQYYQGD